MAEAQGLATQMTDLFTYYLSALLSAEVFKLKFVIVDLIIFVP